MSYRLTTYIMECQTANVRAVQQRDYCGEVTKKVSAEDEFSAERFAASWWQGVWRRTTATGVCGSTASVA